jgi:hypothetical protein
VLKVNAEQAAALWQAKRGAGCCCRVDRFDDELEPQKPAREAEPEAHAPEMRVGAVAEVWAAGDCLCL